MNKAEKLICARCGCENLERDYVRSDGRHSAESLCIDSLQDYIQQLEAS